MLRKIQLLAAAILFIASAEAQPWLKSSIVSVNNTDQTEKKQNFHEIQKIFNDYWKDKTPAAEENESGDDWGYQQFKRWEWFMEPRTYPTGEFFDPEILFKEYQNQKSVQQRLSIHPATTAANWTFIGPSTVPSNGGGVGRINAVRIDPTDPSIVYACSANGGLWKSSTGGSNWSTFTDLLPALGVSDVAVNPNYHDSIFIGTGDRDGYENGADFWGGTYSAGVLVSPDGGQTWNPTGLSYVQTQSNIVHRVLINPDNPNILLAATRTGIYRSQNSGVTWTLVRSGNIFDMEFRTDNSNTVYACTASILYKSTNAGATWTTAYAGLAGGDGTVIAVTLANPNVIYSFNGGLVVKKSVDGGSTFTTMATLTNLISSQGFYNCAIAVSPINENLVFCAGAQKAVNANNLGGVVKSTDGGITWSASASTVHCDHHDLLFAPDGTTIYNTNDGGIYKSTDSGNLWSNISSGIGVKQYYRIGTSALTPYYMYGGAQDNGTDRLKNGLWQHVFGGDGMDCLIDYTNDNIAYVSSQNASFRKTTDGGSTFSTMTLPGTGDWTTPMVMDPLNHNTLYLGLSDLYKSTNAGATWTAISNNQLGGDQISVAVSPSDVNYIYSASMGNISRTNDGGVNWINISNGLPLDSTAITCVAVSSLDPLKIWVTLSGYRANKKVFYSSNGGSTWLNISGSLPNVPADCIVYQKNSQDAVYVGTDFGVYFRDATMADWIPFNTGLPNVMVDDLEIQYGSINKIRAGTYGRGIWESDLNASSVFSLDAGIVNVLTPVATQTFCDSTFSPSLVIRNFGQSTLTSVNINYQLDAGPVMVYNWVGSLASGSNASVTLPLMSASPGIHSFTLFTSDPNGSPDENSFNDSRTTTLNINANILAIPVSEGFDSAVFPPPTWTIDDPNSTLLLQHNLAVGGFGNSTTSIKARCFGIASEYATFNSSQIDFSNLLAPAKLTFSLAYAMNTTSAHDSLKVLVSVDCGSTFTVVYSKTATSLATAALHGGNFTPLDTNWRLENIDLSSFIGQSRVQIQFEFYGDHGNNIYVDDINIIDGTVGVNELTSEAKIGVYPNPTNGKVSFNFNFIPKEKVIIEIFDMVGKKIAEMNSLYSMNGSSMSADLSKQSSGMYFYRITNGSGIINQGKIIKM
jgi:photosystem II stability/assembly factor-like uncharacterized protein